MKTTQQRHAQRIQRVIDHIHGHCADNIDSAAVAEMAQLSAYHWHRIYQAFTRLFSRTYGLPPGKFRARGVSSGSELHFSAASKSTSACASSSQSACGESGSDQPVPINDEQAFARPVDIDERRPLRLVGLWHSGDYHEIGRVFEKVMAAAEIESWPRSEAFTVGVYFDDPDVVPMERCRSFAGIPVPLDCQAPEGYETQEVPGGLHATCLHTGPYALLPESYRCLYRQWLRTSAHDARDSPCYEVYLNAPYNTSPAELETLICLPLKM